MVSDLARAQVLVVAQEIHKRLSAWLDSGSASSGDQLVFDAASGVLLLGEDAAEQPRALVWTLGSSVPLVVEVHMALVQHPYWVERLEGGVGRA